jgi:hypothetical protein
MVKTVVGGSQKSPLSLRGFCVWGHQHSSRKSDHRKWEGEMNWQSLKPRIRRTARRALREFSAPCVLALVWAYWVTPVSAASLYWPLFLASFGSAFFFLSWLFGQMIRVDRQLHQEDNFAKLHASNIEQATAITKLETAMSTLTTKVDSFVETTKTDQASRSMAEDLHKLALTLNAELAKVRTANTLIATSLVATPLVAGSPSLDRIPRFEIVEPVYVPEDHNDKK